MMIKAIETRYNGYQFRSRLEVRWAVFFDALKIAWSYEPQTFLTAAGPYLPDFQIVNRQDKVFIEIKPSMPSARERNKCIALAQCFDDAFVFLCYGAPGTETIMFVAFEEKYQAHLLHTWIDSNSDFWMALHPCTDADLLMAYHASSTKQFDPS